MHEKHAVNLMRLDRWAYLAGGMALLTLAARRPSLATAAGAALGAWLLQQAWSGRNPMLGPLDIRVNQAPADRAASETLMIDEVIAIEAPPEAVYRFWRELRNLRRIAPRLRALEVLDERRSRWTVDGPAGAMRWEAEIVRDEPGRLLAWRTTHRRSILNFGHVAFEPAPGGRGTFVRVHLEYVPPAGSTGTAVARLVRESPQQVVSETLRRLRQTLEAGEIATTDGQSAGTRIRAAPRLWFAELPRNRPEGHIA